uniref:BED-type domain-containing protein n=1 Tax=Lactuca sativa TaxID=4236 RepID=A0A9R1UDG1_LACSA|nr:hypothetical protein LSAT_V11C900463900 [Lactuca sativa]
MVDINMDSRDKQPMETQSQSQPFVQSNDDKGNKSYICNFCQKIWHGGGISRAKKHLAGVIGDISPCTKVSPEVHFLMQGLLKEMEQREKRKASGDGINTVTISDDDEETEETQNRNQKIHDVDLAIVMWFYDACEPNYHALRVNLLSEAKKYVTILIDSYRSQWIESGCTIMSDGWRDTRQRHLINFLVYCPKGISFLKSVDAYDIERVMLQICIVEMVGHKNVVQIVTDNVANYKLAGSNLCERYPSITWSPCAAHCLNLILKDVSELDNWPLNWLRKREGWTDFICPDATRFGIAFIALKSLYDHKADLQAMVISNDFKKMLKLRNAAECKDIVLNENFWKNCLVTVKVMNTLLRLLRLCDSDEKPALGYVYEGMYRARRGFFSIIMRMFVLRERCFKVFSIWLRRIFPFRDSEGAFGRYSVIASRTSTRPDEWWKLFGGDTPILQKFAIRILSQTAPSSGCERNWSVFKRIHTKKRNRLEHQKLNDLVFVHYNLRLKNRLKVDKRSYDPIDYECIDKTDFLVVEKELEGELDYNDLENMLDEEEHEPVSQTQEKETGLVFNNDEVDSEFHLLSDHEIDAYNTPMSEDP